LFGHLDKVGTLEPGKKADLVALSQNIVELAEGGRQNEIGNTRVTLTLFNGKTVYDAATEQP
jgi:predicted amidohydrolase YtcJ